MQGRCLVNGDGIKQLSSLYFIIGTMKEVMLLVFDTTSTTIAVRRVSNVFQEKIKA